MLVLTEASYYFFEKMTVFCFYYKPINCHEHEKFHVKKKLSFTSSKLFVSFKQLIFKAKIYNFVSD